VNPFEALVLGVLQGLTEFIPVSSSGHLVLAEELFNLDTGGLLFDVMLHAGTLLALLAYFRRDIIDISLRFIRGDRRLGWQIVLATIPAAVAGFFLQSLASDEFRSVGLVIFNLAFVGVIMMLADRFPQQHKLEKLNNKQALAIGFGQALALIPGVSRSGITISAGRALSLTRESAARFAFLIAIPITLGAIVKLLIDSNVAEITTNVSSFAVGVLSATLTGYWAIGFLLRYLRTRSLNIFAYYRFGLAAVILLFTLLS
jgi:undecaprenyl-diphosphatase